MWFEMIRQGKATSEDMKKAGQKMRERWENYHLAKALALGFDIDIKKFGGTGYDNFSKY